MNIPLQKFMTNFMYPYYLYFKINFRTDLRNYIISYLKISIYISKI